jgi:hypothetical protein
MLGKRIAPSAVPDLIDRLGQRAAELRRTVTVMLHQMIGNALRGFGPDAGQSAQGLGKKYKTGRRFHYVPVWSADIDKESRN